MNASLTPEPENYVNEKVKSGRYNSASEVLRESLRLLQDHDELQRIRRDELRREIMIGVEQIRNGESVTLRSKEDFDNFADDVKARGRKKIAERSQKVG
ncbi:MAG: type II toxin-antitoxin system ParD family antitoxin [Pyrinomonadaceae bacterium]